MPFLFVRENHDSDRNLAQQNVRPHDSSDADRVLGILPVPRQYEEPFNDFSAFCKELDCPPFLLGEHENYLVGARSWRGVSFLSLNSAWFSQDDSDKGKLWVGLPMLKHLESQSQLSPPGELQDSPICVVLLHHPKEYLNESEWRADSGRKNTWDYLASRCHLILTGHTHGEVRKGDRHYEAAWSLSGGAAFAGASHFNSFRLVRLENGGFVYRSFEYDPQSSDNVWHPKDHATKLPFSAAQVQPIGPESRTDDLIFKGYRRDALAAAAKLIKEKSRALKLEGQLPKTIPLDVLASVSGLRHRFTNFRELILQPKNQVRMPLSAGIKKARRSLLLGDMGAGKSTLIAAFVIETMQENNSALAFF